MAKILIVDDQARFRRVPRLALGVKGYDVREAESGADAMKVVQTVRPIRPSRERSAWPIGSEGGA